MQPRQVQRRDEEGFIFAELRPSKVLWNGSCQRRDSSRDQLVMREVLSELTSEDVKHL